MTSATAGMVPRESFRAGRAGRAALTRYHEPLYHDQRTAVYLVEFVIVTTTISTLPATRAIGSDLGLALIDVAAVTATTAVRGVGGDDPGSLAGSFLKCREVHVNAPVTYVSTILSICTAAFRRRVFADMCAFVWYTSG